MASGSFHNIANHIDAISQADDLPSMNDRLRQSLVSVVTPGQKIKTLAVYFNFNRGSSQSFPRKRTGWFRLILRIDAQRVVHGRATEQITIVVGPNVLIRSRINQQSVTLSLQAHTECIGMAMAAAPCPQRSSIEHELALLDVGRKPVEAGLIAMRT